MRWIELFLDVVREGLGEPISLEFILPHTGDARREIMEEIDAVALYHYKLKVAHESKLRRRFGRAGGTHADVNGEDEDTREVVDGFVHDFSLGDLIRGNVLDAAAEEVEESDDSYESTSEYESETDDETESEKSKESLPSPTPPPRPSPPTPLSSRPAQRLPPSSQPSKQTFPQASPAKSPSSSPAPSVTRSGTSAGARLRKLSMTLRKSRSMTLGSARSSSSNNSSGPTDLPASPPPVPPLPHSVTHSQSIVPLSGRSKPLPPPPLALSPTPASSSSSNPAPASASASVAVPAPAQLHLPQSTSSQKRYPTNQNLPQTPTRPKSKPTSEGLKPPELKKLPELLPIFVEMVRRQNFFFLSSLFRGGDTSRLFTHVFTDAALVTSAANWQQECPTNGRLILLVST